MADKRITELNLHTSLTLSDVIPIVNGGETKKTTYGSLYYGIREGVVSGSEQISFNGITDKPTLVSGSSQIDITQTQNYGDVMITGSLSGSSLVFEKGDTTTFNIQLSGSFIQPAYISCYSTASQQLQTSGSAQPVTFTNLWTNRGVNLVSGSRLVMEKAGTYKFSFVAQLANPDNAVHDAYFWVKYNGNNFPNSTTSITLPTRKDSGDASSQLMTVNIVGVAQNDNDYIELWWTGDSTVLSLTETPAFGSVPETPSIIANIIRIG